MAELTTLTASYLESTFKTEIVPASVPEILRKLEEQAARKGLSRTDALDWLASALNRNHHLTEEWGPTVAHTILWLACTSGAEESDCAGLAGLAEQGGYTFGYEIVRLEGEAHDFRLAICRTGASEPIITIH